MSNVVPSLLQARDCAWRYWESDGLNVLIAGFALTLAGLGRLWSHRHYGFGDLVTLAAVAFFAEEALSGKLVGYLKSRITYPRTGYAAELQASISSLDETLLSSQDKERTRREKSLNRWIWGGPVLLFFLGGFVLDDLQPWAAICFCSAGLWIGWLLWQKQKAGRIGWLQVLVLPATFVLIGVLPARHAERQFVALVALGASNVLWGLISLLLYLKKHPARSL